MEYKSGKMEILGLKRWKMLPRSPAASGPGRGKILRGKKVEIGKNIKRKNGILREKCLKMCWRKNVNFGGNIEGEKVENVEIKKWIWG